MLAILDPKTVAFPVLCFAQEILQVHDDAAGLTTCTKTALSNGYFDDLRVVDANGIAHHVRRAEKIGGIGLMRGFNVFLNQRIRVRLFEEPTVEQWSVDEVRARLLQSFGSWSGWSATGDFDERRQALSRTTTLAALVAEVKKALSAG